MRDVFLTLSCLLCFGCAAGISASPSTDQLRSVSIPLPVSKPDVIENSTVVLRPNGAQAAALDRIWASPTDADRKTKEPTTAEEMPLDHTSKEQKERANLRTIPKRADSATALAARREESMEGRQTSSFSSQTDDSEDDDLSSLFTADYMRQFDIPIVFNDAVQYFVRYFTTDKRKVFANWLRRSRRYVPMIKEILREQGLPEDLIYLAMIESGFNPKAYSPMKACGPWQFVYDTGGRYGLRVDHWVDERRDPEKSTVAAALYLKDLFNQFGNWYLAAAGYNAGEKRIERAVEKHETTDFWEITKYNTLPRETRDYIPRLLAAAIIAKDPEKFGFLDISYDLAIRFISEKVPGATSLATVALAASSDLTTIKSLNPEILTGIAPPDVEFYTMKLPEAVIRERFRENLRIALNGERKLLGVNTYVCKRRDNLASIAKRHMITENDLILVNSCDQGISTRLGAVIYIPKFQDTINADEPQTTRVAHALFKNREGREVFRPPKKVLRRSAVARTALATRKKADHRLVKKGDNRTIVVVKYRPEASPLKRAYQRKKNGLYPVGRLRLAIEEGSTRKRAQTTAYHVVKKGETLSEIADKYDVDPRILKEMNRLKKSKIRHGMKLKVSSTKTIPATRG